MVLLEHLSFQTAVDVHSLVGLVCLPMLVQQKPWFCPLPQSPLIRGRGRGGCRHFTATRTNGADSRPLIHPGLAPLAVYKAISHTWLSFDLTSSKLSWKYCPILFNKDIRIQRTRRLRKPAKQAAGGSSTRFPPVPTTAD